MMPTFPRSPLSFRTAGFPQYGWKAGISDRACPRSYQAQARSRHTLATSRFASVLRASRRSHDVPALSRGRLRADAPPRRFNPPPQGSSLGARLFCPGPSSLNRPHPSHSPAHRDFAAWRLIRDAFAVRERLGDPRVVPCFRCCSFSACRPLRPRGVHRLHLPSSFTDDAGLHRASNCSALPTPPPSASSGTSFSRLNRFACATACRVACLPGGSDRSCLQPTETFTFGLSTSRSPFSSPSITTVAAGQLPPAGLSPAGSAASIRCTEAAVR